MNNTAKCECLSNIVYKAWMLHILGYSVYRQTKQIKSDYYPPPPSYHTILLPLLIPQPPTLLQSSNPSPTFDDIS